jgi:hypothetical protein
MKVTIRQATLLLYAFSLALCSPERGYKEKSQIIAFDGEAVKDGMDGMKYRR